MVRYHGNWCGPGWTAGQYKDTSELTDADRSIPAIDSLDEACKDHDIEIHDAKNDTDIKQANRKFYRHAAVTGLKGAAAAAMVAIAGPKHPNKRKGESLSNFHGQTQVPWR